MITIEDLRYAYPDGTEALAGIDVAFGREQVSAILGESGSGKTTLLRLIGRFLRPTAGRILLDEDDIADLPERDLRQAVGIVFQRLHLFPHLTVLDNLTLAPRLVLGTDRDRAEREARTTLERLGIADLADSYPAAISGGQAQRAAIARGLMLKPRYMLLDEPTSALDAATTAAFAAWLRELHETTRFIVVTHDVIFARDAARSGIHLAGGTIDAAGPIEEMIERVSAGPARRER